MKGATTGFIGNASDPVKRRKQFKQKTLLLRRKQKRCLKLAEITEKVYMNIETIS
jgi:hypothetical protein